MTRPDNPYQVISEHEAKAKSGTRSAILLMLPFAICAGLGSGYAQTLSQLPVLGFFTFTTLAAASLYGLIQKRRQLAVKSTWWQLPTHLALPLLMAIEFSVTGLIIGICIRRIAVEPALLNILVGLLCSLFCVTVFSGTLLASGLLRASSLIPFSFVAASIGVVCFLGVDMATGNMFGTHHEREFWFMFFGQTTVLTYLSVVSARAIDDSQSILSTSRK
jgi:hypothetical protein